ncbi:MAG: hypothetical protein OXN89_22445 [Bryobacterales bacterium]|nr:hypothetical protein [Bryobacterales bacterium]
MGPKADHGNGVFAPLQKVDEATPGEDDHVLSGSEPQKRAADVPWLKASELSFEFWDNKEDSGCDSV